MPVATRLYPYELSTKVELKPEDPYDPTQEELDLSWLVRPDVSDDEVLTLDLSRHDVEWRELRVKVHGLLPTSELKRILAPGSVVAQDTMMVVSINCPTTKLRRVAVLDYVADGRWTGTIEIHKYSVGSVVQLVPRLVRSTDRFDKAESTPVAHERAFMIAEGRSLRLLVDQTPSSIKGVLTTYWVDFREPTHPWRKEHDSNLYHLDVDGREPILWLNARYTNLRAALHSHVRSGGDAVIRHLGNAAIAQSVWLQLFMIAVTALDEEEDGNIGWPQEEWKKSVLEVLVTNLFPGLSEDEQLRRLFDMRTGEQAPALVSMLGTVAQEVVGSHNLVGKAVAAAASVETE